MFSIWVDAGLESFGFHITHSLFKTIHLYQVIYTKINQRMNWANTVNWYCTHFYAVCQSVKKNVEWFRTWWTKISNNIIILKFKYKMTPFLYNYSINITEWSKQQAVWLVNIENDETNCVPWSPWMMKLFSISFAYMWLCIMFYLLNYTYCHCHRCSSLQYVCTGAELVCRSPGGNRSACLPPQEQVRLLQQRPGRQIKIHTGPLY
jgi:hypothetical protein